MNFIGVRAKETFNKYKNPLDNKSFNKQELTKSKKFDVLAYEIPVSELEFLGWDGDNPVVKIGEDSKVFLTKRALEQFNDGILKNAKEIRVRIHKKEHIHVPFITKMWKKEKFIVEDDVELIGDQLALLLSRFAYNLEIDKDAKNFRLAQPFEFYTCRDIVSRDIARRGYNLRGTTDAAKDSDKDVQSRRLRCDRGVIGEIMFDCKEIDDLKICSGVKIKKSLSRSEEVNKFPVFFAESITRIIESEKVTVKGVTDDVIKRLTDVTFKQVEINPFRDLKDTVIGLEKTFSSHSLIRPVFNNLKKFSYPANEIDSFSAYMDAVRYPAQYMNLRVLVKDEFARRYKIAKKEFGSSSGTTIRVLTDIISSDNVYDGKPLPRGTKNYLERYMSNSLYGVIPEVEIEWEDDE
jgi:hypothetical protein